MLSWSEIKNRNTCCISMNEELRGLGKIFSAGTVEEAVVVDDAGCPMGVVSRAAYLDLVVCTDPFSPVRNFISDYQWMIVEPSMRLGQLLLLHAEYYIDLNEEGKFLSLLSKRSLAVNMLGAIDDLASLACSEASLLVLDSRKRPVYFSPAYHLNSEEKTAARTSLNRKHPVLHRIVELLDDNSTKNDEARFICEDDLIVLSLLEDSHLIAVLAVFDMNETWKHALSGAKKMKEMYEEANNFIENSYVGYTITDGRGKVLRVNRSHERITGSRPDEMVGKYVTECVRDGQLNNPVTLKVLEEKRAAVVRQYVKKGKEIIVTGNPVFDADGNIKNVVCNLWDPEDVDFLREELAGIHKKNRTGKIDASRLLQQQVELSRIVAESPAMKHVLNTAVRVAANDVTVLLLGETGVGKEIVARTVHNVSNRRDHPFIKINCAALPASLLESELFGYEEGAFTGAKKSGKPGFFEIAGQGSLFLDEIGDIPMELQGKMLRALQEKEIYRVGSTTPKSVHARIICATNRDLGEMVAAGRFREDLYYRLYVVPIYIPGLRFRREDIIPMMHHYLDKFNQKYGMNKAISPELENQFCQYEWPGNVRELENMIERLVILVESDLVSVGDIKCLNELENFYKTICGVSDVAADFELVPLHDAKEKNEKMMIEEALRKYGSMGRAAEALGVDRTTVLRKINKYGIDYQYKRNG